MGFLLAPPPVVSSLPDTDADEPTRDEGDRPSTRAASSSSQSGNDRVWSAAVEPSSSPGRAWDVDVDVGRDVYTPPRVSTATAMTTVSVPATTTAPSTAPDVRRPTAGRSATVSYVTLELASDATESGGGGGGSGRGHREHPSLLGDTWIRHRRRPVHTHEARGHGPDVDLPRVSPVPQRPSTAELAGLSSGGVGGAESPSRSAASSATAPATSAPVTANIADVGKQLPQPQQQPQQPSKPHPQQLSFVVGIVTCVGAGATSSSGGVISGGGGGGGGGEGGAGGTAVSLAGAQAQRLLIRALAALRAGERMPCRVLILRLSDSSNACRLHSIVCCGSLPFLVAQAPTTMVQRNPQLLLRPCTSPSTTRCQAARK
jgi:hypothetical protein